MLLNVLEVIAPFKHFAKLREFVQMKLPSGFPVKIGKDLCFSVIVKSLDEAEEVQIIDDSYY